MQNNLSNVQTWCHKWCFKISVSKSVAMLFTRKRKLEELVGGTELENCLSRVFVTFEAFRLTLIKKDRQSALHSDDPS